MASGLERRLSVLEKIHKNRLAEEDKWAAEMRLLHEAAQMLEATMSPEYLELLKAEVESIDRQYVPEVRLDGTPCGTPLLDEARRRIQQYLDAWRYGGSHRLRPLALPPAVAAVYVKEAGTYFTSNECEDCGYEVPAVWEYGQGFSRWHKFFENCPLCGGKTGYQVWKAR